MGFRGEALASIAAVAQIELKTKPSELELGVQINVEASDIRKKEPITMQNGTSLSVKNLFFNVPARRNFLKSKGIETRPIFYPIHLMPMYKGLRGAFPKAESIAFRGINLPSYPELTQNELDYICSHIISFFDGSK